MSHANNPLRTKDYNKFTEEEHISETARVIEETLNSKQHMVDMFFIMNEFLSTINDSVRDSIDEKVEDTKQSLKRRRPDLEVKHYKTDNGEETMYMDMVIDHQAREVKRALRYQDLAAAQKKLDRVKAFKTEFEASPSAYIKKHPYHCKDMYHDVETNIEV
jgi:hypothetical protein